MRCTTKRMTISNVAFQLPVAPVAPLAKVWNREYAIQRLAAELASARQQPNGFSILLIQFDGLSMARRERLGFALSGDLGPRVFALLTRGLRGNDACCHMADDEFLLILPGRTEVECSEFADLLKRDWAVSTRERETTVELRAGWATANSEKSTIAELFATADEVKARTYRAGTAEAPLPDVTLDKRAPNAAAHRQPFVARS
jgi:diguanylate cyclase (GGDEF)-like protein